MCQIREGGFQTRPHNSEIFFAPFALFAVNFSGSESLLAALPR
jgi:hypothetical protein